MKMDVNMRRDKLVRGVLISLMYYLFGFICEYTVIYIARDSSCRYVYGMISAWCLSLYISNVFGISIKDIKYLAPIGIAYAALLASKSHDTGYSIFGNITIFVALLSPIFINSGIQSIKKLIIRTCHKKAGPID
jgi:hypothetical protein